MKEELYYDDGTPYVPEKRSKPIDNTKELRAILAAQQDMVEQIKQMHKDMCVAKPKKCYTAIPTRGLSGLIDKVTITED